MKKLWNKYSYAIILMILSLSLTSILSFIHNTQDNYRKITVSKGDTLWNLSEQYASQNSLTNQEFVNWVKKHNPNAGDKIIPGEKIMIPVSKQTPISSELASAPEK